MSIFSVYSELHVRLHYCYKIPKYVLASFPVFPAPAGAGKTGNEAKYVYLGS